MKKVLVSAIAVLAMAGIVNATAIGLQWQGNPAQATPEVAPNTPTTAQFYVQHGAAAGAPTLTGIGLYFTAYEDAALTILADGLHQVSSTPTIPNWVVASTNRNGQLNNVATQFASANGDPYAVPVGQNFVMDIAFSYDDPTPPAAYYNVINRAVSSIFDNTGADYMNNDAIWYDSNLTASGKARWGFGNWGGGAWSRFDSGTYTTYQQAANPIILTTPEPSALALLVLGGFAAIRRR